MKFRRKSAVEPGEVDDGAEGADGAADAALREGPFDAGDLPDDGLERIDLGSLLVAQSEGRELRIQVDETTGQVQAVMLAAADGMLELRAFAAPRGGDLWSVVREQIAGEFVQQGGTATEREGRFGPELVCSMTVTMPDGESGTQASRVIGVNGPRWLLRATLLGRPAVDPDGAGTWEDAVASVAVRRGEGAMMSGEPLPVVVPSTARRLA